MLDFRDARREDLVPEQGHLLQQWSTGVGHVVQPVKLGLNLDCGVVAEEEVFVQRRLGVQG